MPDSARDIGGAAFMGDGKQRGLRHAFGGADHRSLSGPIVIMNHVAQAVPVKAMLSPKTRLSGHQGARQQGKQPNQR
ncbi:hypothetical protein CHELA20_51527 [Hyphomicrobiales bacterium]|nr:hypothetical protein CHELA41_23488 [Hyphomicrobiales bacterium]CAH1676680.1 hypothetical protein CHELA20_51527 [Hyphomicrobiales bacterium]